jgi:hypothetical protein
MKLKFGYDLSGLSVYVDENKLPLLMASVFSGDTASTFEIQDGIKYKDTLNYLDAEVLFRANTGCSTFTASGDTTFTQKEISVAAFMQEQSFCPDDLNNYWARVGLQKGSYQDKMAFEREWVDYYTQLINKQIELMLWQGEIGVASGNLALVDGFLDRIAAASGVVDGNLTGGGYTQVTTITAANIEASMTQMLNVLPNDVEGQEDLCYMMGWDSFKKYLLSQKTANNFFYDGVSASPYKAGEVFSTTFGIKVKAFRGLDGTNRMFLGRESNFVIGTDLKNDWENFQIWYEQKDDKILTRLKAKLGTEIKFGAELVQYTNK